MNLDNFISADKFNNINNKEIEVNYIKNKYNLDSNQVIFLQKIFNYDYASIHKNKTKFNLVISLYDEKEIDRCIELLTCLFLNIINTNICLIHILYEVYTENEKNYNFLVETTFILFQISNFNKYIKMEYIYKRPSFSDLFSYVNNNIIGKTIISNSDIIYDNSLYKIQKLNNDQFCCISRKNYENNEFHTIKLDIPQLKIYCDNIFSHDTWICNSPIKYEINIDINIGEMFCDSYLNYKLCNNTNYKCYNLANDINCFHIQKNDSFSEKVKKDENLQNQLINKINKKENDENTEYKYKYIYALNVLDIKHFYENKNFNMFISHKVFINKYENKMN
jgi:hypothetical protein